MKNVIVLICFALFVGFSACKNQMLENANQVEPKEATASKTANPLLEKLKGTFARALAISLYQSPQLRETIKTKALEMFNKDTEVLYFTLRDLYLENGQTVESLILSNYEENTSSQYEQLMNMMPTLTILVPELPEDSFSAKGWNLQDTLRVGVRQDASNDVPLYSFDGSYDLLEGGNVPDFPVLVVKNNERVMCNQDANFEQLETRMFFQARGVSFKFTFNEFDGSLTERRALAFQLDPKLIQAFNIFEAAPQAGWQRDFIYYNITPTNPNGPLVRDFEEHIKSFRMTGEGVAAYNKISDQTSTGDPSYVPTLQNSKAAHWTGGSYEFLAKVLVNSKTTGIELVKPFYLLPKNLFDIKYEKAWQGLNRVFRMKSIDLLEAQVHVPLFKWNLDEYSAIIKISIEEVDVPQSNTLTTTSSSKFATNFQLDATLGEKIKIGGKFGASSEILNSQSAVVSYTQGNDILGDVVVDFADKIIISQAPNHFLLGKRYNTREYGSGSYSISIEPVKVQ